MSFNRIAAIAATILAVTLSFALLACSESNPTNADEPIAYSEPVLETSSALESSSSAAEMSSSSEEKPKVQCESLEEGSIKRFWVRPEGGLLKNICSEPIDTSYFNDEKVYAEDCNAENEGRVLSLRAAGFGGMSYYRCENGSWEKGNISLTCDTAIVQVGDACVVGERSPYTGQIYSSIYTYAGDGNWNSVECDGSQCVKELIVGPYRKTEYYMWTFPSGWYKIDEIQYTCFTEGICR